ASAGCAPHAGPRAALGAGGALDGPARRPLLGPDNAPLQLRGDLPLYHDSRWPFPDRPPARRSQYHRRLALLRPWLQIRTGDRRDPRRPRDLGSDGTRHRALFAAAVRLTHDRPTPAGRISPCPATPPPH